jgi:hypothetical protein
MSSSKSSKISFQSPGERIVWSLRDDGIIKFKEEKLNPTSKASRLYRRNSNFDAFKFDRFTEKYGEIETSHCSNSIISKLNWLKLSIQTTSLRSQGLSRNSISSNRRRSYKIFGSFNSKTVDEDNIDFLIIKCVDMRNESKPYILTQIGRHEIHQDSRGAAQVDAGKNSQNIVFVCPLLKSDRVLLPSHGPNLFIVRKLESGLAFMEINDQLLKQYILDRFIKLN